MWTVKKTDTELNTDKYDGYCIPRKKTILLDKHMNENKMGEALIHEILHAVFPAGVCGGKVEEEVVTYMASRLHDVLENNNLFNGKRKSKNCGAKKINKKKNPIKRNK